MKSVSISGSLRENVGKKDAKVLRKQGYVPCVLYGGKEQVTLKIEERKLMKFINTPEVFTIRLEIDDKEYECIFKEIQFHPVTDRVLHVDFMEVFPDKPVVTSIPIKIRGTSPGILAGGKLIVKLRRLNVKGLYSDFPGFIDIDLSGVELGDTIKVRDLSVEGLEFTDPGRAVVAMVKLTRGAMGTLDEDEEEGEGEEGAEGEGEGEGEGKAEGKGEGGEGQKPEEGKPEK